MIKLILVFSIAMQCISCSNSSANEERSRHNNETTTTSNTENTYTESQLNSLLKCGEYAYINGYFAIPDGGCIYFPERNSIGNVEIYAIPKTRTIDIENIDTETNLINSLSANELKETHTIYMIIVDKKYLSHTPNLETPYHPEIPYKQNIYENSGKTWKAVRSISINNENDTQLTAWIDELKRQASGAINSPADATLDGNYTLDTEILTDSSDKPTKAKFYFSFKGHEAIISIGTRNHLDAYCEGAHTITNTTHGIELSYSDEGICTSNEAESKIKIKHQKGIFYAQSQRFYSSEWQPLVKSKQSSKLGQAPFKK